MAFSLATASGEWGVLYISRGRFFIFSSVFISLPNSKKVAIGYFFLYLHYQLKNHFTYWCFFFLLLLIYLFKQTNCLLSHTFTHTSSTLKLHPNAIICSVFTLVILFVCSGTPIPEQPNTRLFPFKPINSSLPMFIMVVLNNPQHRRFITCYLQFNALK